MCGCGSELVYLQEGQAGPAGPLFQPGDMAHSAGTCLAWPLRESPLGRCQTLPVMAPGQSGRGVKVS